MTFEKRQHAISTTDQLRGKVVADRQAARDMLDAQFQHLFNLMALTLDKLNTEEQQGGDNEAVKGQSDQ
jgi:hypothetical protein